MTLQFTVKQLHNVHKISLISASNFHKNKTWSLTPVVQITMTMLLSSLYIKEKLSFLSFKVISPMLNLNTYRNLICLSPKYVVCFTNILMTLWLILGRYMYNMFRKVYSNMSYALCPIIMYCIPLLFPTVTVYKL